MDIKIRELKIDAENPFVEDALKRETEIVNLSNLLFNVETPLVLSINGEWGSGKTTFIHMWEAYLRSSNTFTVYFNAWETDFAEDPLVAFLGEMNESFQSLLEDGQGENEFWKKTKAVGGYLAKRSLPVLVKLGTAGLIDTDKIIEDEVSNLTERFTNDAVDHYGKTKDLISDFKENLQSTLSSFSCDANGFRDQVVVFVDELDRCRPTYALELLERIKHFLNIEGILFVLSLDKIQLGHSIKAVYGQDFESTSYLKRFIDIEYSLKCPEKSDFIKSIFKRFDFDTFFLSREKYQDFNYEKDSLLKLFVLFSRMFDMPLREIEQTLTKIYLVILSTKEDIHLYSPLLLTLILLKDKNNALYCQYVSDSSNGDDVVTYLREKISYQERIKLFQFALLEGFILGAKRTQQPDANSLILKEHHEILANEESDQDAKHYADRVIDVAKKPVGWRSGVNLESLVNRIELLEQFEIEDTDEN